MKIMLRTSGGRGEYEIAGSQGGTQSTELNNKRIFLELFPGFVFDSKSSLQIHQDQGKPRIRLENPSKDIHAYRLLSGLLLLKKPIRELHKTENGQVFKTNYSITSIDVDIVSNELSKVILRPKTLTAKAGSNEVTISVASRIVDVQNIIESVANADVRNLYNQAKKDLSQSTQSPKDIEKSLLQVYDLVNREGLDQNLSDPNRLDESLIAAPKEENDTESEKESFLEDITRMRMVKIRGPKAQEFSRKIKEIYRHQCLFSGLSLPSTRTIRIAGVEAAHILPWASSGINSLQNGICLNGLCHWAFDTGLLYMTYKRSESQYILGLNQKVRANPEGISVEFFSELAGPIPKSRLPSNRNLWPNPDYLDQINSKIIL